MRISQVFQAWGPAQILTQAKANEDAAYVGCNTWLTSLRQIEQAAALREIYAKLMKVRAKTHPVFLEYAAAILIPMGLGAVKTWTTEETVEWLHSNLGNFCQIASLVSTVALLYFGEIVYATTTLTIIAIGYLNRHHYLPFPIEKAFLKVSPWIGDASNLLYGDWMLRLVSAIEGINRVMNFFKRSPIPYSEAQHLSHLKTLEDFASIVNEKVQLEVNPEHVWIEPFPPSSRTDFASLITFCNHFEWPFEQLIKKLNQDPRWKKSDEKKSYEKSQDSKIVLDYAKKNFQTLVRDVQNQCIATGQILDYTVLLKYLGYIADYLEQASLSIQTEVMLRMAIEGGDYCGQGIYYQLEVAAITLLQNQGPTNTKRLPFKQRLLLLLQQERLRIVEAFHLAIEKINWIALWWFGGSQDIHAMNFTIQLLGQEFGLPNQGASQDQAVTISKLEQWVMRRLLIVYPQDLWSKFSSVEGYTVDRILETVQMNSTNPLYFDNTDVWSWAQGWNQDEKYQENLVDGTFEPEKGTISLQLLKAMLVDLGIFRIKSSSSTSQPQ